ncbi:MAG: GAF domain-containing sensor histidine kinase [Candidatus Latescibacteria bacterium]|nr:GAF domain-containing sensor histidine kinase [Candidatus Latescibacterota bacterium]
MPDQLKQRNRELSILNAIAHALNQSVNLDQALETALEKVAALLGLSTSWIWLMHEDTHQPYLAAAQNLPPVLRDNPSKMGGWCYCLDTYHKGDLKGAANVNVVACSRLKGLVEGTDGLQYHASIPLYAQEKKVGVLNVGSVEWRELSDEDLRLLNTVGDLMSIAIERARLYEKSIEIGAVDERFRLARELHDTLGQNLVAILMRLETLDALLDSNTNRETLSETVRDAIALARDNLEDARRAVLDLRAAPLENRTLIEALETLGQNIGGAARVRVKSIGEHPLSVRIEASLYRMAQEALNNIAQHADAQKVLIELTSTPQYVQLVVEDDGRGFDPENVQKDRYGLIGLNERAHLLGGSFAIESAPNHGTRLEIHIPLEREI